MDIQSAAYLAVNPLLDFDLNRCRVFLCKVVPGADPCSYERYPELTVQQAQILFLARQRLCVAEIGLCLGCDVGALAGEIKGLVSQAVIHVVPALEVVKQQLPAVAQHTFSTIWSELRHLYGSRPILISAENGDEFRFGQIEARVLAWTRFFCLKNIKRGDRIAVYASPCVEYCCVIWAAWLHGAAVVALEGDLPKEQARAIVHETQSKVLFVDKLHQDSQLALQQDLKVVFGESEVLKLGSDSGGCVGVHGSHTQPAVILFTSGSLGKPKGVVLTQGSLFRTSWVLGSTYGWGRQDRLLSMGGFHAMSGMRNPCVAALLWGATVVIPTAAHVHNPVGMAQLIQQYHVTLLCCVPATLNRFIQYQNRLPAALLTSLKTVMVTAAPLSSAIKAKIKKWLHVPVYNYYGLTVTGGVCVLEKVQDIQEEDTIGSPTDLSLVQIVDEQLCPVGGNQAGELRVFSLNNMLGYYQAGMFDDTNNLGAEQRGRWINTGDLAAWTKAGNIRLLGRKEYKIKNKYGDVVYFSEVEKILEQFRAVIECCVVSVKTQYEEEQLVVFLVAKQPFAPTDFFELTQFASERLGAYKMPDDFIVLGDLPRNANEKPDRAVLVARYQEGYYAKRQGIV